MDDAVREAERRWRMTGAPDEADAYLAALERAGGFVVTRRLLQKIVRLERMVFSSISPSRPVTSADLLALLVPTESHGDSPIAPPPIVPVPVSELPLAAGARAAHAAVAGLRRSRARRLTGGHQTEPTGTERCSSCDWTGTWDGAVCPECGAAQLFDGRGFEWADETIAAWRQPAWVDVARPLQYSGVHAGDPCACGHIASAHDAPWSTTGCRCGCLQWRPKPTLNWTREDRARHAAILGICGAQHPSDYPGHCMNEPGHGGDHHGTWGAGRYWPNVVMPEARVVRSRVMRAGGVDVIAVDPLPTEAEIANLGERKRAAIESAFLRPTHQLPTDPDGGPDSFGGTDFPFPDPLIEGPQDGYDDEGEISGNEPRVP